MTTETPETTDTTPAQLESINRRLDDGADKMRRLQEGYRDLKAGQKAIADKVDANTEITQQIRDLFAAGKVSTRVIKWAGTMALAGSAIWGVVYAAFHNGKLPHQ